MFWVDFYSKKQSPYWSNNSVTGRHAYLYRGYAVVHESPSAHFCNQVRPIVPSISRSRVESAPKEPIYKRGVSCKLRPTLQLRALPKFLTTFNTFVSYMSFSFQVRRPSLAYKGRGSDVLTVIYCSYLSCIFISPLHIYFILFSPWPPPPQLPQPSPGIISLSMNKALYSLSAFE